VPKRSGPSPEAIEKFKQAIFPELIKIIQTEKAAKQK
jgi:hypothetical protein